MDMILHFGVGLVLANVLLRLGLHIGTVFAIVLCVAIGKELNDTKYTIDILENIKDIFFTMLPLYFIQLSRIARKELE